MPSENRAACRNARRRVIFNQQQIESFVLGTCPDNTAVEIEEALFSDDAFFAQVQQTKTALLSREASGQLTVETSASLALQLDRSPKLREELQHIRESQAHQALRTAVQPRTPAFPWRFGLGFAAAAAVLALIAGIVLRTPTPAASHSTHLTTGTALPAAPTPHAAPVAATILFLPSTVLRGPSELPQLPPPDPTRPVELQIQLRSSDATGGTQWKATLARQGQSILSTHPVSLHTEGTIHYLSLLVPPGQLPSGQYRLTLISSSTPSTMPSTLVERSFIIRSK